MTVNSLLSERLVSKGSLLSFLNDVYDVGKQTFLRGREVIQQRTRNPSVPVGSAIRPGTASASRVLFLLFSSRIGPRPFLSSAQRSTPGPPGSAVGTSSFPSGTTR